MKRILLLLCGIMLVPVIACSQHLVEVGKGYSCTSVNTTVFRNNSLVTHGDEQYISYYDNDGYLVLGKRKLDSEQWTLHRTQYQGNVKDAHNIISMMIDGEGYMHVSFDHHGHPLNYCRSIAPGSLELGDKMPMTGVDEGNVTYPEFYPLSGGDLLFVYRSGSSGRGNLVMNRYSLKEHKWTRVQDILIDGENKRNAYWQLYVDEKGTILFHGYGARPGMWKQTMIFVMPVLLIMGELGIRRVENDMNSRSNCPMRSMPVVYLKTVS